MDEEKVLNNSEQEKVDLPTENLSLPQQQDKNMGYVGIVVIGLAVVVIGVLGYMYFFTGNGDDNNGSSRPTKKSTATPTEILESTATPTTIELTATPTTNPTVGWNTYSKYPQFSFMYPTDYSIASESVSYQNDVAIGDVGMGGFEIKFFDLTKEKHISNFAYEAASYREILSTEEISVQETSVTKIKANVEINQDSWSEFIIYNIQKNNYGFRFAVPTYRTETRGEDWLSQTEDNILLMIDSIEIK